MAFQNKKLSETKRKWLTHEKEMWAIIHCLKTWGHYIGSKDVVVWTNNVTLKYFSTQPKLSSKQVRWQDTLVVATLALGSRPRQKGLQGCESKGSLGVTSETPRSEGECEGVSHHTPKATPTLGDGVPVDSRNFREIFEGSNLNGSWRSLYHWKALEA